MELGFRILFGTFCIFMFIVMIVTKCHTDKGIDEFYNLPDEERKRIIKESWKK